MKKLMLLFALAVGLPVSVFAQVQETLYTENFGSTLQGITPQYEWYGFFLRRYAWSTASTSACTLPGSSGGNYYRTTGTYNGASRQFDLNYDVSTQGLKNIKVSWNAYRASGATAAMELYYSTNGSSYTKVTGWADNTATGSWVAVNNSSAIALPNNAANTANLRLRFVISISGGYYAMDDLVITGEHESNKARLNLNKISAGDNPFSTNKTYKGTDNKSVSFQRTSQTGVSLTTAAITNTTFKNSKNSLTLIQTGSSTVNGSEIAIAFSEPVKDLSFTIFDVDNQSGQFQDILYVEGYYENSDVMIKPTTVATGTYSQYNATTNQIQALTAYNDVAATSDLADVAVDFAQPVSKVVVRYYNGNTARGQQGIGIDDLYWNDAAGYYDPLPVELVSFNAKVMAQAVDLSWKTASEKNNEKFVVERSRNGIDFEAIGEIKGHGNSNKVLNYKFTDLKPEAGVNYYRLHQVDFDGASEYSKVVAVEMAGQLAKVSIYPNPATDVLYFETAIPDQPAAVSVSDMNGMQVISTQAVTAEQNSISIGDLKAGIYLVVVEQAGSRQVVRIVKQ